MQLICSAQDIFFVLSQLKTDKAKADTLQFFSDEYIKKLKYDSALYWITEGANYAQKAKDNNQMLRFQLQKTSLYNMTGKYRKALDSLRPIEEWMSTNLINHKNQIGFLMSKATAYMLLGKKDSAVNVLLQAETVNKNSREAHPASNWEIYTTLAEVFNRAKDFDAAEKYYLQAYKLLSSNKNVYAYGYILLLINNFYLSWDKAEKAGFYIAAYNQYQKEKIKRKVSDPLQNIIESVINGQLESNTVFMAKVKDASIQDGNFLQAIIANGYSIRYYKKKKKFEEALPFVEENIQLSTKINDIQSLYLSLQEKYQLLQNIERHKEATAVADALFLLKDSILNMEHRDRLYELEKKYESEKKAKEIELLTFQKNISDKEIALLTSDKKLAAIYLQQGILKQNALRRENGLMDSIVRKEKQFNALLQLDNDLKSTELNKEQAFKEALARENDLKMKELKRQKQIKWGLLAGVTLLLFSAVAIFSMYAKQKNKSNIIQQQANDLEVLMKEIHHRVKNNLQIVSSLLDLQSHSITDNQAHEAVKEGKNRVQSMALIHQNLYSEGNIKGIKLREYVDNLLQTLCHSYNISNEKVKMNMDIEDLNLDVDTMIPLGLVLNELVSNVFKYAFPKNLQHLDAELSIFLKQEDNLLHLKVRDNGCGFPIGLDVKSNKSFGLKMIRAFAQKLKAKLDIYNANGAVIEMQISKFKLA